MTGAFFLGICINYPNGLFNSSLFQVWPWAEDFLSVFGCSVECMHSYYPCSLWYVLECCCYCTFFEVQFLVIAILVWTCLTVFFLGSSSKYYIVTSCGYFRCRVDAPLAVVRPSQNPDLHFRCRVGAPLTVVHPSQNSGRAVFPHPALCETNRSHYHSYILTYIRGLTSG